MKKLLFSVIFACLIFNRITQGNIGILKGLEGNQELNNVNLIRIKSYTGIPNYIQFISDKESIRSQVFKLLNKFSKNPLNFSLSNIEKDQLSIEHHTYFQTIGGKPFECSIFIAGETNDKVLSVNGDVLSKEINSEPPSINFSTALYVAKGNIGA